MARVLDLLQSVFSRGELSKRAFGRRDNDIYQRSLKYSRNIVPHIQGCIRSRPGTKFVLPVKNSADDTVIVEFQFSIDQSYVLEIGDQYARVFKDREPVLETAQTITDITQATEGVVTATSHGFTNGRAVYISGVVGMTELNDRYYVISDVTTNTFKLKDFFGNYIDTSGFTAYSSGGDAQQVFEISTPWSASDVMKLRYIQSVDVLYFFHEDYEIRTIGRVSDTNWTVNTVTMNDGPWMPINATSTTVQPSAATGTGITITASTGIFSSTDVGRHMRMKIGSNDWGYAEITGFTSSTSVTADVIDNLGAATTTTDWRFSVFGGDTYGYPSVGLIHEERFVVGGSKVFYDAVGFSQTGLYENDTIDFAPSEADGQVIDSNGFIVFVGSENNDKVTWLQSARALVVGTGSSEASVSGAGPSSREPITPERKVVNREANYGSREDIRPQLIGNSILYVDRSGTKIRETYYDFAIDGFLSRDTSILNADVIKSGVKRVAFQKSPDPVLWMACGDGSLVGFTFDKVNEVEGYHAHTIGGTDTKVKDVAIISRPDGVHDDTYLVVERTINGQTVKYIEYITPYFEEIEDVKDALFVDSAKEYSFGSDTTVIDDLHHLEGETVSILADGSPHPEREVTGGSITLQRSARKVKVGFSYDKEVHFLSPEVLQIGTTAGKQIRINKIHLYLVDSVGVESTTNNGSLFLKSPFTKFGTNFNQPVKLKTGILTVTPSSGYDQDDFVKIKNNQPLPLGINYIVHQVEINS